MKTPLYTTLNSTSADDNQSDAIVTALCHSLPSDTNADAGIWLPLVPIGAFAGRDGRSWVNNEPEHVIKNTALPFILDILIFGNGISAKTGNAKTQLVYRLACLLK